MALINLLMLVPCLEYRFKLSLAASSPFLEYKLCCSVLYRLASQKLVMLEIPKHKYFHLLTEQNHRNLNNMSRPGGRRLIKMLNSDCDLDEAE